MTHNYFVVGGKDGAWISLDEKAIGSLAANKEIEHFKSTHHETRMTHIFKFKESV